MPAATDDDDGRSRRGRHPTLADPTFRPTPIGLGPDDDCAYLLRLDRAVAYLQRVLADMTLERRVVAERLRRRTVAFGRRRSV